MRKTVFTIVSVLIVYLSSAQVDMIQLYHSTNKFEEAKNEVDKALANPKLKDKDKPILQLWKMLVYSELYASTELGANYTTANNDAVDALKAYTALDPSLKVLKEENFTRGVGLIYSTGFDKGRDYFQKEDWENSYKYFAQAAEMSDFIISNSLNPGGNTFDTTTILFTGFAAQNAKKSEEAVKMYIRLADLKVVGPEYLDVYRYLIDHYEIAKDEVNYTKYFAHAKELYPNESDLWSQVEMRHMTSNGGLKNVIEIYTKEKEAGTLTESKLISFAEAFAQPDQEQLTDFDSTQQVELKMLAAEAFGKAFDLNSTNGLYAFNSGVLYYNVFSLFDEKYSNNRGEGAALKAKREEIAKEEMVYAEKSIVWLVKSYDLLKAKTDRTKSETNSLNRTVDYLANIYQWKRDRSRGVNPKDYDAFDARLKQFEDEHNAYH